MKKLMLLLFLFLSSLPLIAQADIVPHNSKSVQHNIFIENFKHPEYTFVLYPISFSGENFSIIKKRGPYGGYRFSGKIYAFNAEELKTLNEAEDKIKKGGEPYKILSKIFKNKKLPKASKAMWQQSYVKASSKVERIETVYAIREVKGKTVLLDKRESTFGKGDKQLSGSGMKAASSKATSKPAKGSGISTQPKKKGSSMLGTLGLSFWLFGFLIIVGLLITIRKVIS